MVGFMKVGT